MAGALGDILPPPSLYESACKVLGLLHWEQPFLLDLQGQWGMAKLAISKGIINLEAAINKVCLSLVYVSPEAAQCVAALNKKVTSVTGVGK